MPATQSTNPEDTRAARDGEETTEEAHPRVVLTPERIKRARAERGQLHWVPTPEIEEGSGVFLPTLKASDRAAFETSNVTETKHVRGGAVVTERTPITELINERLFILFVVDEDGNKLYQPEDQEDTMRIARELAELPAPAIGRVGDKISELMGWSSEDLEDLVGN